MVVKRPSARLAALIALVVSLGACGYRTTLGPEAPESRDEPGAAAADAAESAAGPTRVSLIALRSESPEPWLDRIVTDALRRELGARARIELIEDPDRAQMRVEGRIRPLNTTSRSFSSFVAALEFSLTLTLDLEIDLENGEEIHLDHSMLSETEAYLASPDIEITRTNRLEVLRRLSDLIAVRVADAIELIERPMPVPASTDASLRPTEEAQPKAAR